MFYGKRGRPKKTDHIFKWKLLKFWKSKEWESIKEFLAERKSLGRVILPPTQKVIFRCFDMTPFKDVRIVILGQDPYYQKGVADGLAFSVLPNQAKLPGTLRNILAEYREDLNYSVPRSGDLSSWARNGILLLNTVLTVEEDKPNSHYKINGKQLWQELTTEVIREINNRKEKVVFILWGKSAQEWRYLLDESKHLVLVGPHPSPRNFTYTGKDGLRFRGGSYFSKAAAYLDIDKRIWRLP